MQIFDIHFLLPLYFYGFIFVPILLYLYIKQEKKAEHKINFGEDLQTAFGKNNTILYIKIFLIFCILCIFIFLLADPNKANIKQNITKNGIDIVLALDISGSMEAADLKPNRLEKAKITISDFIEKQKTNRVGLIIFAGKPVSSVPLTFDYNILTETLENVSTDSLNQNVGGLGGTAIGDTLLMGKNLFGTGSRDKTIILLTDGDATSGVDPIVASKLLGEEKIKIYTIGIGSKEGGIIEVKNGFFTRKQKIPPLNARSLKEIAKNTSGHFFRATDDSTLEKVFSKLEDLEKNDIEVKITKSFSEYYTPFIYTLLLLIFGLLILEIRRVKTH